MANRKRWMLNVTGVNLHLGCLNVLLGIHNLNQDQLLDCFNYCMSFAKDYTYNQKKKEKYPCSLSNKTEQFEKQWSQIVNDLM